MKPSTKERDDQTLQELLNAEMEAEAELLQIDENIFALENKVIGKDWWDGNFIIKWSRYINEEKDQQLHLQSKDRVFSISSATSKTSGELTKIENHLLDNNPTHAKNEARKKFHTKIKKDKKLNMKHENSDFEKTETIKRRRIKRPNKKEIKQKTVSKTNEENGKNPLS